MTINYEYKTKESGIAKAKMENDVQRAVDGSWSGANFFLPMDQLAEELAAANKGLTHKEAYYDASEETASSLADQQKYFYDIDC